MATPDENADGCCLMKWTGNPFCCEEREELVVKGKHLNPVKRAPFWHTESEVEAIHLVNHVVSGFVLMEKVSEDNQLPAGCKKQQAEELEAKKICMDNHEHILEEMIRREALEDPDCEAMKKEHGRRMAQKMLAQFGCKPDGSNQIGRIESN